jgi:hypothetical protein
MSTRKGLLVIVLVLIAVLAISGVAAAGKGFWKGVPNTADNCVTTYTAPDASAPIGQACFRWTKLNPGYFFCQGNLCYLRLYYSDDWIRTDEVDVTM